MRGEREERGRRLDACARGEALGCCAGRGEKSGPRWAVREGKKGEMAWAVWGLGLGRFWAEGLVSGFLVLGFFSYFFPLFYFLKQTNKF